MKKKVVVEIDVNRRESRICGEECRYIMKVGQESSGCELFGKGLLPVSTFVSCGVVWRCEKCVESEVIWGGR